MRRPDSRDEKPRHQEVKAKLVVAALLAHGRVDQQGPGRAPPDRGFAGGGHPTHSQYRVKSHAAMANIDAKISAQETTITNWSLLRVLCLIA